MSANPEPILFLWDFSLWANKIVAYLSLRGIPFSRCEQPLTQPRPDIAALGVNYRRIPLLSIGRDIYCDTLLIIQKLERLYPSPSSEGNEKSYRRLSCGPSDRTGIALEKLLEKWADVVVFKAAATVISTDLDLMKDEKFQKDREELWGRSWGKAEQDRLRPAGLANMRANFEFLENLLGDGREWILGGEGGPMLADIHACCIFDWLLQLPGTFPEAFISSTTHPYTFAWRDRYNSAIVAAKSSPPSPPTELSGPDAIAQILTSDFSEPAHSLEVESDPIEELKEGAEVEMWPIDTGYNCRDSGRLVKLDVNEMVVETQTRQDAKKTVRIHYPRWNFEIVAKKCRGKRQQGALNLAPLNPKQCTHDRTDKVDVKCKI